MTPFIGELVGTMLLIIFGGGVIAGVVLKESKAAAGGWIVITFGWGLGVAMAVYAVGQFSGAHLNPAVTLALASLGEFPWRDVPGYILAQMIGAFIGASVVWLHYAPHWEATSDSDAKRAVFCTDPAIDRPLANLASEIIGTFVFVVGILAIGANQFTDGLNPLIVGLLVLAIGLSLGGTTGYAINPARDLGPRLAHALLPIPGKGGNRWQYAWIPVVGPIIGGLAGAQFYQHVFLNGDTLLLCLAIGAVVLWLLYGVIGARRQAAHLKRQGCD